MAKPIQYEIPPAPAETTARQELDRLLETCHRHGLLRLANDLVAANQDVAQILIDGLRKPGTLNAIQNLSVLLMALSCIPPAEFYRLVFAAADGAARLSAGSRDGRGALGLILEGLKGFAEGLQRPVASPIVDFCGKPGRPS